MKYFSIFLWFFIRRKFNYYSSFSFASNIIYVTPTIFLLKTVEKDGYLFQVSFINFIFNYRIEFI